MTDNNSLLMRIHAFYNKLTKLEKKVADYVLSNPQEVLKMTISDLSTHCGVGETTVFRFCRSMKLKGYQDFKLALALSSNTNEMLDTSGEGNLAESHDLQEMAQQVSAVYTDAVAKTLAMLDYDSISNTVDAIMRAKSVHLFGFGNSSVSAFMLQNRLMRILPNVFYSSDAHMQLNAAALLGPESVAIIFCNSGITKDCIRIAQMAHEGGATTVFVTKFRQTPAASFVDILLCAGSTESPLQGGSISGAASQIYIVMLLYTELFRRMDVLAKGNKIKTSQSIADKRL